MTEISETPTTPTDNDFAGLDTSETETEALVFTRPRAANQLTPWTAADYAPIVRQSGAVKLASSGIAPLVMAARGYESVAEPQAKDFSKRNAIGDGRSKRGQQFNACFRDGGDLLSMPWYSVDQQVHHEENLIASSPVSIQIRPQNPRKNEKGKLVKYEFLTGSETVLDFHPAVTREWSASAPKVLLAEGLLKGDATLSALLRAHVDESELLLTEKDNNKLYAKLRLARLLNTIPAHERVAVVSLAGVGNWKSNPEWAEIQMKDKDVYVAFDGDVSLNWNVWTMADQLFRLIEGPKHGHPHLLLLDQNSAAVEAMMDGETGLGLDDFFHHVGEWSDFDSMITEDFPVRPARPMEMSLGEWRVTADGNGVEECAAVNSDSDSKDVHWVRRYDIGGRILFSETRRAATDDELATAVFGSGVDESEYDVRASVQIKWRDTVAEKDIVVEVTGPHTFLGYAPADWDKRGAVIPKALMFHPQWPPKKGLEWLGAIKSAGDGTVEDRTTWSTMGYVPVQDSMTPAFIAGNSIIALEEDSKARIRAGVGDADLTGARKFGLSDVFTGEDYTDPSGLFDLRDDIRSVVDAYVGALTPWKTKEAAACILAMGLRPSIPLPTAIVSYLVGPPAQGKSWTARMIMAFWQSVAGTWESNLPGSANDTFASTEKAVSQTPIWVADDLAPQSDRRAAEMMESSIGTMIRGVFNRQGKRRMNYDMTSKVTPNPMALLILTAENEHSVPSIRERVVSIDFTGLRDEGMNTMENLSYSELTASRVNAAVIRMFLKMGEADKWESVVQYMRNERENGVKASKSILAELGVGKGDSTRPSGIIADLALGLSGLGMLAAELGMKDIAAMFTWEEGGLLRDVATQVSLSQRNKSNNAPGRVLLDCIADLLATGYGHIANINDPTSPPITQGDNQTGSNVSLGWQADANGVLRPRGQTIGWFTRVNVAPVNGGDAVQEEIIAIDRSAFNIAQKTYPARIQFGSSATTAWKNVWDSGLIHPAYQQRRPASGVTHQFRTSTLTKVNAIPLNFAGLFPDVADSDELSEEKK
jgi:hypothetical protein